ncbi:MAG: HYR domain-containing protein, partial [Thermoleophilia bacterium]
SSSLFWNAPDGTFLKTGSATTTFNGVRFDNDGGMEVQGGTLNLSGGLLNFSGTTLSGGSFVVGTGTAGATLRFTGANIQTNESDVTLNGSGASVQNESGADALAGFATNGVNGTLTLTGDKSLTTAAAFSNLGLLALEGTGSVAVPDTFATPGELRFAIAGVGAGTGHGQVRVIGVATLGGTLQAELVGAFVPGVADEFPLITHASSTGTFSSNMIPAGMAPDYRSSSFVIVTMDTTSPVILDPPGDLTVEATGPEGALAEFGALTTAGDLVDGPLTVSFNPPSGSTFPVGVTPVTYQATDAAGNIASGSFQVNVQDTTPPELSLPADFEVEAAGATGASVTFAVQATDLVDPAPTLTASPASGDTFPVGPTSVTVSARDAAGNRATGSFLVTVVDRTPPPSDTTTPHTTSTIDSDWHATDVDVTLTATDGGSGVAETWYKIGNASPQQGQNFTVSAEGETSVSFWSVDNVGNTENPNTAVIRIDNTAPVLSHVTAPVDPTKVGTTVPVSATFTDEGPVGHTAVWTWDDATTSPGAVDEAAGLVTGTHTYTVPGVYEVTLTITDWAGRTASVTSGYIVVYDPNGGFATGGGWFNSPVGAYPTDADLTGKATFGFVSKYKNGATVPTGETEFQFKAGDLNFHSAAYDWLVVSGARAQYKGTGTINGKGAYGFMLTATDGQMNGGGGVDKLRMKIWDKATGNVVYDNNIGASDDAAPAMALGGGAIVVHK